MKTLQAHSPEYDAAWDLGYNAGLSDARAEKPYADESTFPNDAYSDAYHDGYEDGELERQEPPNMRTPWWP